MARTAIDEVEVLRFFETEPLDKATVLFNIVTDKMRVRLNTDHVGVPVKTSDRRRTKVGKVIGTQPAEPPVSLSTRVSHNPPLPSSSELTEGTRSR